MSGREADGARVVRDVVQPQRSRVADEDAEDAASVRRVADLVPRRLVDARRDEALETCLRSVGDAERRVPCARDLFGRLDELLQEGGERERGPERDARLDEPAQPLTCCVLLRRHAESIAWRQAASRRLSTNGRMPPCRRYSRSRGVSNRRRARNSFSSACTVT